MVKRTEIEAQMERLKEMLDDPIPVLKLGQDLRQAAAGMGDKEVRYLVDGYYMVQDMRIRVKGQIRAMENEPTVLLQWFGNQFVVLEAQLKGALDHFSRSHPVGQWMRAQKGVGPVISAGFLAHLDIHRAPNYGHFHSYCGIHPDVKWEKGQKRPFNAALKRLCFLVGESFIKVKGNADPGAYGPLYDKRKALEIERNDRMMFEEEALRKAKIVGKATDAYKSYSVGKLPPGHIHARARRYAAKMFLCDLHTVWHWIEFQRLPPIPYIHAMEPTQHTHIRWPPGHEMVPGLTYALRDWTAPAERTW